MHEQGYHSYIWINEPVGEANAGFLRRRVAVEGSIRYSTKATNANILWVILRSILNLRVRDILESDPMLGTGAVKETAISLLSGGQSG